MLTLMPKRRPREMYISECVFYRKEFQGSARVSREVDGWIGILRPVRVAPAQRTSRWCKVDAESWTPNAEQLDAQRWGDAGER